MLGRTPRYAEMYDIPLDFAYSVEYTSSGDIDTAVGADALYGTKE